MKGIIFNLVQETVQKEHGNDAWDDLLEDTGLDGAYTSLGNYPDEHLGKLVGAAARRFQLDATLIVRWVGASSIPILAGRYPHFFAPHKTTRSFLLALNDIIHPEVRKLYPGADAPEFDFTGSTGDVLMMSYRSQRKLCSFAEGLIEGAAGHYGEAVMIEQSSCANRGDERCVFRVVVT